MLRVSGGRSRTCAGWSRRDLLQAGSLALLGATGATVQASGDRTFGRARSLILIDLYGGPAHQDVFDLKPEAPAEVRGEFKPIETNVSGIRVSEHIPRLAKIADKYTLIRSMTHTDNEHATGGYTVLTGVKHPRPGTILPPSPDDFPPMGSIITKFRPPHRPVPGYITLGGTMYSAGGDVPGQTGGLAGQKFDPFDIGEDPSQPNFKVRDIALPAGLPSLRLDRRRSLLSQVDQINGLADRNLSARGFVELQERAFNLMTSPDIRQAFELSSEPDKVRDAYGRHKFGQSCLMARRLVQTGVPVVAVYWERGQVWDTHGNNFKDLKDRLLPPMDQGVAALLTDLSDQGMLEDTIVLVTGEFGRTPKINGDAGRDHWPGVYTSLLAGGGFKSGFVYGSSDEIAAYPATDPVQPWDLAATIYHLLGIDPGTSEIRDRQNRPIPICVGDVVRGVLA
ncbi:MAG: DUF1501 domain-containing protein [Actinomycetota bacterium]